MEPRRGHQGEYLDANPLERAPDGEVKALNVDLDPKSM